MKTIGMIGGTSWESTQTYYRLLNERTARALGGLHSARCLLYSVDFAPLYDAMSRDDWDAAGRTMAEAARTLQDAGADFLLLCANTSHKFCGAIAETCSIPILHIADAVTAEIRARGLGAVGLLGTKYTMQEDFYVPRLERAGVRVLTPRSDEMEEINRIIYGELCVGVVQEASRARLLAIAEDLRRDGAEGVILGCTELPMLLRDGDLPIPLLDTVEIHCAAAVRFALQD